MPGDIRLLSIVLAGIGVVLAAWRGFLFWRKSRRDSRADLRVEGVKHDWNQNYPGLRQASVSVRNVGGATAHEPCAWVRNAAGEDISRRFRGSHGPWGAAILESGSKDTIGMDLPVTPEDGVLRLWVGWGDTRGEQERDADLRLEGSEPNDAPDPFRQARDQRE